MERKDLATAALLLDDKRQYQLMLQMRVQTSDKTPPEAFLGAKASPAAVTTRYTEHAPCSGHPDRRSWATREVLRTAIVTWTDACHRRHRQAALSRLPRVRDHHDRTGNLGRVNQLLTWSCRTRPLSSTTAHRSSCEGRRCRSGRCPPGLTPLEGGRDDRAVVVVGCSDQPEQQALPSGRQGSSRFINTKVFLASRSLMESAPAMPSVVFGRPPRAGCGPARILIRVDLPDPFWPSNQWISPAKTSMPTSSVDALALEGLR